jgi:hypothetical protein
LRAEYEATGKAFARPLHAALRECRGQIDFLRTAGRPISGNTRERAQDNRAEIAMLEIECQRLSEAIAILESGDVQIH